MSANLLSLFLLALTAQSALSALVARVDGGNVQVVPYGMNRYNLRLQNPYGSVLDEYVNKNGPGEYQVMGRLNQPGFLTAGNLVIGNKFRPRPPTKIVVRPDIDINFPQIQPEVSEPLIESDTQHFVLARGAPPPSSPPVEPEPEDDWMKMYEEESSQHAT